MNILNVLTTNRTLLAILTINSIQARIPQAFGAPDYLLCPSCLTAALLGHSRRQ